MTNPLEFEKEGKTIKGACYYVKVETPLGPICYKIVTNSKTDKIILDSVAEKE